jgi:hypothetical protein
VPYAHELQIRELPFVCERPRQGIYKGLRLDCGYRVDLIVAEEFIGAFCGWKSSGLLQDILNRGDAETLSTPPRLRCNLHIEGFAPR